MTETFQLGNWRFSASRFGPRLSVNVDQRSLDPKFSLVSQEKTNSVRGTESREILCFVYVTYFCLVLKGFR